MPTYQPPRRVTSTATSITVEGATSTPAWVQTINVGEYATIPATPTVQASAAGYDFLISAMMDSDSGWAWNDDYGPGGAMLFVAGGHTKAEYPYAWVFDGLKVEDNLPGWRAAHVTPQAPCSLPGLPALYYGYAPFYWDEGSEFSSRIERMPVDAIYAQSRFYCKTQEPPPSYGYPAGSTTFGYGECATQVPAGTHQWNIMYPLQPGQLGTGSKGGWASSMKHSVTSLSGVFSPWGHIFDAETSLWKRQFYRWPANGSGRVIANNGASAKACAFDGYAYTLCHENSVNTMVRTNLTTGVHDHIRLASTLYPHIGSMNGVDGTTIIALMKHTSTVGSATGARSEWKPQIINVDPAINYTARVPTFINIDPATPNPLADPQYHGHLYETFAHSTAEIWWIPEVGKFAAYGAQKQSNVDYGHGDWPFGIVWYTPPNPPEEGTATWFTGLWTCELEPLTAVDALSQVKENRGAGSVRNASGSTVGSSRLQYRSMWYSRKLRCFIHMPEIATGNIFFFRSSKLP